MPRNSSILNESLMQAHQLVWQPGKTLHTTWWQHWHLTELREVYPRLTSAGQRTVDGQIISLRRLPLWQPEQLTAGQIQLLRLQPRMVLLLTALGLQQFGCRGYLWLPEYRQTLNTIFSERQLCQLSALMLPVNAARMLDTDELLSACLHAGQLACQSVLVNDPLWQMLQFSLPRLTEIPHKVESLAEPLAALLRLERFL